MVSSNSLSVGTILKGLSYSYRIEKTLGQGSFGITYLASVKMAGALGSIDANIRVAIKEFFMRDINGRSDTTVTSGSKDGIYDDYKRKFKREALNLSKLEHPNIIKVIESFEANNTVYYVMEYIGGGSLDDYIARNKGLEESEAIRIVKQIGSALSYMHSCKMLHLDLKPSNVMMKESGDVVLIDFGLSKQYDANGEPESSTKIGGGTPGYAPIEQANYREGKGFPVTMDVYALGGTMFKMLTGIRPPEASEILNDGFPFYELQERGISDRTSASVVKAMSSTKKDRYDSVKSFIDSFEEEDTIIEEENGSIKNKSDAKDTSEKNLPKVKLSQERRRNIFVTIILYGIQLFSAFCFFFMLNELRLWPDEMLSDSVWLIRHAGMPQFALLPVVVFICNWMVIKWKRSGLYLLISLVSLIVYPLILLGFNNFFLPSTAMSFSALATYWALLIIPFNGKTTWSLMIPSTSIWIRELFVVTIILWFPIALCGSAEYPEQAAYVVGIPLFLILLSVHLFIEWIRNRNKAKNSDSVKNESVKNRFVDVKDGNIKLYVKIAVIALLLTSLATLVHFIEMATDSYGISGSENETVWVYVWIWTLSAFVLVFRKKLPSLITFAINFIKEYKQSKLNHHE